MDLPVLMNCIDQAGLAGHAVIVAGVEAAAGVPHGVIAVEELVGAGIQPGVGPGPGGVVAADGEFRLR